MPPGFLEQWKDNTVKAPDDFDVDTYSTEQAERLRDLVIIASLAYVTPGRISGLAHEKGRDKRFMKMLRNRATSILKQWGMELADVEEYQQTLSEEEIHRYHKLAKDFDPPNHVPEYFEYLREQLHLIAACADTVADRKECNRMGNRIFNELAQINQFFEEIFGKTSS